MTGFLQQQTIMHTERESDIVLVAKVLELLGHGDVPGAQRLLIQYHDMLCMQSKPRLVDYDPRLAQSEAR